MMRHAEIERAVLDGKAEEMVKNAPLATRAALAAQVRHVALSCGMDRVAEDVAKYEDDRIKVTRLVVYPVKSCRGIDVTEAEAAETGFAYDRKWMVVDEKGVFLTQRNCSDLGLIHTALERDGKEVTNLVLSAKGKPDFKVPNKDEGPMRVVDVWGNKVSAHDCGDDVAAWIASVIQSRKGLRLVRFNGTRKCGNKYVKHLPPIGTHTIAFADGYPYLIIGTPSLCELNRRARCKFEEANGRAPTPDESEALQLVMDRFRPNIVVDGPSLTAYGEDKWLHVEMQGKHEPFPMLSEKACERCVLTTIDPATRKRGSVKDPNHTLTLLNESRDYGRGPLFGQNMHGASEGVVHVGDEVVVLSRKNAAHLDAELSGKPLPSGRPAPCLLMQLSITVGALAAGWLAFTRRSS